MSHHKQCCDHEKNACHHEHGENSCCSSSCHHSHGECDFSHQLLELADEAWMEVLKEKIKDHIRANKKMDELAKIISDSNNERWQHKMATKKVCESYKEKLASFFFSGKSK